MSAFKLAPLPACLLLLLAACGGGGGGVGSAGSSPPPTGGTTPGNTTIGDLRNSQTFTNTAAATQVLYDLDTKTTLSGGKAAGALTVSYDAASKTYSLSSGAQSQQFTPAEIVGSANGETRYQKTGGGGRDYLTLVTTPYSGTTANQYVGLGYWQRNALNGSRQDTYFSTFTYGLETPAAATPRAGHASFTIDVFGLASTPGFEPRVFQGSGTFFADLMTGVFSAQAYTTETGLLSGSGIVGGGIEVNAAGRFSSSDGQFAGNALYGGTNGRIAGTIAGRFYGPAAQELGASFGGGDANGASFNGAFTGQRDAAARLANQTLTNMVTSQLFYTQEANLTVTSFENDVSAPYVRSTMMISQLNRQNAETFTYSPGRSDLAGGAFTLTAQVASADPNFTAYQKSFNGQEVFLDLYKPGSANTELALTYASFGGWRGSQRGGVVTQSDRVYFAHGLMTQAGLLNAKTGTARYAGVAYGAAANEASRAQYDVTGTSSFNVDFGAQSMTGALALRGKSTNGAADVDFGTFDFATRIGGFTGESVAVFTAPGVEYGRLSTRFHGPDGEEIAGPFSLNVPLGRPGERTYIVGVAAAKRQ